jgi:hypothetical protein
MQEFVRIRVVLCALVFGIVAPALPAAADSSSAHIRALDRMMAGMARESARASATMRRVYRDHLDLLFLHEFEDLEGALANGGVAPLPEDPHLFNLMPRLDGPHPIGEKDLSRQASYLAARPATIGVLLELASRVHTGRIEITSLVRHGEYQEALRVTNTNASTSVPMHTMGLAFDIALIHTPLRTVYEIRKVLREMRDAGDVLFIGERKQLVFHVVPHPSRLGHFNDVYTRAMGTPSATQAAVVVAELNEDAARRTSRPTVVTEVVAIAPGDASLLDEWELALHPVYEVHPVEPVPADATLAANAGVTFGAGLLARGLLALAAAIGTAAYRIFAA